MRAVNSLTSAPSAVRVAKARGPGRAAENRRWRFAILAVFGALVLWLEWKPEPSLDALGFLPAGLRRFYAGHDFFNNLLGFGGLAAAVHFACAGLRRESSARVWRRAGALALGVVLLEAGQIVLPLRSADWQDVAAGWIGIALASLPWMHVVRPLF
jgi:hypothetical protein